MIDNKAGIKSERQCPPEKELFWKAAPYKLQEPATAINSATTLGERIKEIRKSKKLTQQEFSKLVYVSPSYICKVEADKEMPTDMLLKLISFEFHISFEWLLTGEADMENITAKFEK